MVYIVDVRDEPAFEDEINRADIETCTDEATLSRWYREMLETKERISTDVESYRFVGTAKDEWLDRAGGKIAILSLGMKWVERRMIALDFDPPYPPSDRRNIMIRGLEKKIKRLKQVCRDAGVEVLDLDLAA